MMKYTDEYSDEEIHRVRAGRVPRARISVPLELVCTTLLAYSCAPTWKISLHTVFWGLLWRLHYVGVVDYWFHF